MPNPRFGKTRGELDPPQEHSEFIPWWMTADTPWQALATCFEIAAAVRSPNPAEYCCSLPVHQVRTTALEYNRSLKKII